MGRVAALDGKVSLGSARRNFVASTQPSRQTPSAASGGTVSPAGSVGAERSPPESCAPVGGGRPPHRGGCRQRRLGEYESSLASLKLTRSKSLGRFFAHELSSLPLG